MTINTEHFKLKLEEELKAVEAELMTVGRKNPSNPGDWEAKEGEVNTDTAEDAEIAEGIEVYENNSAILKQLEIRFNELKDALAKIDMGNYGICEISGLPIEEDRLEVNPAARTCKAHMND
ncbi:MAG: TraR/DksA C4-type zinc finger protein [Candidatus Zambryskibacteria bacterium]|nr:TraR/DksA C4-type zinc finger protein [Candidatus Zambryskibacteria bacterium]